MPDTTCVPFAADCHVRAAAELINHRWDPVVLAALRAGPTRRSLLLRRISGASDKIVSASLRRLVARGLVTGSVASGAAIYELSDLGASFAAGPLLHLAQWASDNHEALVEQLGP